MREHIRMHHTLRMHKCVLTILYSYVNLIRLLLILIKRGIHKSIDTFRKKQENGFLKPGTTLNECKEKSLFSTAEELEIFFMFVVMFLVYVVMTGVWESQFG